MYSFINFDVFITLEPIKLIFVYLF